MKSNKTCDCEIQLFLLFASAREPHQSSGPQPERFGGFSGGGRQEHLGSSPPLERLRQAGPCFQC